MYFYLQEDMQLPRVTEARKKFLTNEIIQVIRNAGKEIDEIQSVQSGILYLITTNSILV